MHCTSGKAFLDKTRHRVAYCAQNPCTSLECEFQFKSYKRHVGLEHATIRDNIIYGSSRGFDQERYRIVIEACALVKDLEVFDAGDLTGKFTFCPYD